MSIKTIIIAFEYSNFNFWFKVFIYPSNGDKIALYPIVSDEIVDKKAHSDLRIVKMTDKTSQAKG